MDLTSTPIFLRFRSLCSPRLALILGLALLIAGIGINLWKSQVRGEDFGHMLVVGKSFVEGLNVYTVEDLQSVYRDFTGTDSYTPWGVFYTPSSGMALLPLTFLPYQLAKITWFVLACGVLLGGVWQLMRVFVPDMATGYRVLVLGALMCTSAARWGFFYMQAAPLLFGLLCFFVVALHRKHAGIAFAIGAFAICLKFTLILPFMGMALLKKRLVMIIAICFIWGLVNVAGFARMGGMAAVSGYQEQMTRFNQVDQLNYPDFREPNSMQRTDWPYLLNAPKVAIERSQMIGHVLSVLALFWLCFQMYRLRDRVDDPTTEIMMLGPLVCLSLLSVYHHHYDSIALFGPLIGYLALPNRKEHLGWIGAFSVPVVLFAGIYQIQQFQVAVDAVFGEGSSIYLKLMGVVCVNIAFIASLVLLQKHVNRASAPDPV